MSIQITVRLPDELVEFADERVRRGLESSRPAAVAHGLRELRQQAMEASDLAVYRAEAGQEDPDGLSGLAAWNAAQKMDID